MVLGAGLGAVDRAGAGVGTPFLALMWEASAITRSKLTSPAAWHSASNTWCRASKTPAACQSRSRRQQVMPDPNPSSCGRSSQPMPVTSTNRMPCSTSRSSIGFGPDPPAGRTGNNGSISFHNRSSTTHGAATHRIATRLLQHPNNHSANEHTKLNEIQAAHPHLDTHTDHITAFPEIPTGRHDDHLDTRITTIKTDDPPHPHSSTARLRRNHTAATNRLTLPHNPGPAETTSTGSTRSNDKRPAAPTSTYPAKAPSSPHDHTGRQRPKLDHGKCARTQIRVPLTPRAARPLEGP